MINERAELRRQQLIRTWRIVVLLRCAPHTVEDLASKLSVSTRTIRRDLKALQAVPLPIAGRFAEGTRRGVRAQDRQLWSWGELMEWPRRTVAPVADLCAPPSSLPPFPKGPLFPPGIRP